MKKAGTALMIVGVVLIVLQMLSMIGNARAGTGFELTGDAAFDIGFCIGYFFIGIQGLIVFIVGIILRTRASSSSTAAPDDSEQASYCPRCGAASLENSRFCGACGMPLDSSAPDRGDG